MLRTILSYLVLIFVPAVSLAIAVVPYVIVRKKVRRLEGKNEIASQSLAMTTKGVGLKYLWLAFVVGLVGNVGWWSVIFWVTNERISVYFGGMETDGVLLSLIVYSIVIVMTPFIFYKFRHGHFTGKAIVYNIIISLITAGLVLGVWIVLALIAYRGLFYRLN